MLDIFKSRSSLDDDEVDDARGKKQDEGPIEHLIKGFIADDVSDLGDRIVKTRVMPTIAGLLKGVAHDAIDGVFRSDSEYYYRAVDGNTDYRRISGGAGTSDGGSFNERRGSVRHDGNRRHFNSRDYTFKSRGEAEVTLDELKGDVASLGKASLAKFLMHTQDFPNWNDYNIGWTDLSTAYIRDTRTSDGVRWVIFLPPLVAIK